MCVIDRCVELILMWDGLLKMGFLVVVCGKVKPVLQALDTLTCNLLREIGKSYVTF